MQRSSGLASEQVEKGIGRISIGYARGAKAPQKPLDTLKKPCILKNYDDIRSPYRHVPSPRENRLQFLARWGYGLRDVDRFPNR